MTTKSTTEPTNKQPSNISLFNFANYAKPYQQESACESKLQWAMFKLGVQVSDIIEKQNNDLLAIRRSHAAENEKGVILSKVAGEYQFTKEGEKAMYDECLAWWDKPCGIIPYFVQAKPKQALTLREIDILEGFVLSSEMADEMRKEIEDKLTTDLPD